MKLPCIAIILPALNEELTVGRVIDEIPKVKLQEMGYEVKIVVVDNNSTDQTLKIAEERGAEVILEPIKGKGWAVRKALKSISSDFIFILDADYTYPATYIPEMLQLLQSGQDVVIGSRLRGQMTEGAMSKMNLIGNRLLVFWANTLYRTHISDLCTGYWGFAGRVVSDLLLEAKGFELEAAIFSQIAKRGYDIAEVPILYRKRTAPSNLSSLRDGIRIWWTLITKRFQ
jgi:dolichol-phosphate mannosyltransferase